MYDADFAVKDPPKVISLMGEIGERSPLSAFPCRATSRHGKQKNYVIGIGICGVYIMKPKDWRISKRCGRFFSILDLESITYKTETKYILYFANYHPILVESLHVRLLMKHVLPVYANLMYNFSYLKKLKVRNFPKPTPHLEVPMIIPPNLLQERYQIYCAKYKEKIDLRTQMFFSRFEATYKTSIKLDSYCKTPGNYRIIAYPLAGEPNLSIVHFKGFAPKIVCKIIRSLLKKSKSITTIILEDYNCLNYYQLDMTTINDPGCVCFSFSNINLQPFENLSIFFEEFSKYTGDVQSLSLDRLQFDKSGIDKVAKQIKTARCYRTLECLSLYNLKIPNDGMWILQSFFDAVSNLKSIVRFSVASWSCPLVFTSKTPTGPIDFFKSESLRSLSFTNVDMRYIIGPVLFPANVHEIQFSKTKFTGVSLLNLLDNLSKLDRKLVLVLDGIDMLPKEWDIFWNYLQRIIPLRCLIELDWSDNQIPEQSADQFIKTFFSCSPIRYVSLSRVFDITEVQILMHILQSFEKSNLWGIEIEGGENYHLNAYLPQIAKGIYKISTIQSVNLSYHKLNDSELEQVFQYFMAMPMIREIQIDGNNRTSQNLMYELYKLLLDTKSVNHISKPLYDISSICDEKERTKPQFINFRDKLSRVHMPICRHIRSFFYYYSKDLDLSKIFSVSDFYPITCMKLIIPDKWGFILIEQPLSKKRSINDPELKLITTSLCEYQNQFIPNPFKSMPLKEVLPPFNIPAIIVNCRNLDLYRSETQNYQKVQQLSLGSGGHNDKKFYENSGKLVKSGYNLTNSRSSNFALFFSLSPLKPLKQSNENVQQTSDESSDTSSFSSLSSMASTMSTIPRFQHHHIKRIFNSEKKHLKPLRKKKYINSGYGLEEMRSEAENFTIDAKKHLQVIRNKCEALFNMQLPAEAQFIEISRLPRNPPKLNIASTPAAEIIQELNLEYCPLSIINKEEHKNYRRRHTVTSKGKHAASIVVPTLIDEKEDDAIPELPVFHKPKRSLSNLSLNSEMSENLLSSQNSLLGSNSNLIDAIQIDNDVPEPSPLYASETAPLLSSFGLPAPLRFAPPPSLLSSLEDKKKSLVTFITPPGLGAQKTIPLPNLIPPSLALPPIPAPLAMPPPLMTENEANGEIIGIPPPLRISTRNRSSTLPKQSDLAGKNLLPSAVGLTIPQYV